MSLEHSQKLINEIADRKEADEYMDGLLKAPEMRADMEQAERQSKWEDLSKDIGAIQQPAPPQEQEIER